MAILLFIFFWKTSKNPTIGEGAACVVAKWRPQTWESRMRNRFLWLAQTRDWLSPGILTSTPYPLEWTIWREFTHLPQIIIYYFLLSSIIIYWKVNIWTTFRHFVSKDVFSRGTSSVVVVVVVWGRWVNSRHIVHSRGYGVEVRIPSKGQGRYGLSHRNRAVC